MSFSKLLNNLQSKLEAYGYRFLYDTYQLHQLYRSIQRHVQQHLPFSVSKKSLWKCINSIEKKQKHFEILLRTIAEIFGYKYEIRKKSYDFIPEAKPLLYFHS